jgi:hypothetical protein
VKKIIPPLLLENNKLVAIKVTVKGSFQMMTMFCHNEDNTVESTIYDSVDNHINVDRSILGCDLEIFIINEGKSFDINLLSEKAESPTHGILAQVEKQIDVLQDLQQNLQQDKRQQKRRQTQRMLYERLQKKQTRTELNLQDVLKTSFSRSQLMHQLKKVLAFCHVFGKFINEWMVFYNSSRQKPNMYNFFEVSNEVQIDKVTKIMNNPEDPDFPASLEPFPLSTSSIDLLREKKKTPIHRVNEIFFKNLKFYTYIIEKTDIDDKTLRSTFGRLFLSYLNDDEFRNAIDIQSPDYFQDYLPEEMFKDYPITRREQYSRDPLGNIPYQEISTEDLNHLTNDFDYYFVSSRSQSRDTFKTIFASVGAKVIILPCLGKNPVNLVPAALSTDSTMDWSFYSNNSCPKDSNMIQQIIEIIFCEKVEDEKIKAAFKSDPNLRNFRIYIHHPHTVKRLLFCEQVIKDILKFSNEYSFQSSDISDFIQFLIPKIIHNNLHIQRKYDKEVYIYISLIVLQELSKKTTDEFFSKYLGNILTFAFRETKREACRGENAKFTQHKIEPDISKENAIKLKKLLENGEDVSGMFMGSKLTYQDNVTDHAKAWLEKKINEVEEYKPEEILPLEPLTDVSRLFPELVNKYILQATIDVLKPNVNRVINMGIDGDSPKKFYNIIEENLLYEILDVDENAGIGELKAVYDNRIEEKKRIITELTAVRDLLLGTRSLRQQQLTIGGLPAIQQEQQQRQLNGLLRKLRRDKLLYKVLGIEEEEEEENELMIGDTRTNRIEEAYEKRIAEINEQYQVFHEIVQFFSNPQNKQLYDQNYRKLQEQRQRERQRERQKRQRDQGQQILQYNDLQNPNAPTYERADSTVQN